MTESDQKAQDTDFRGLRFTPSGQKRMEEYQAKFAQVLRRAIRDQRPSFTDRVIEITAADVDKALNGVKLISSRKLEYRRLVFDIYAVFGAAMALVGVFYDKVEVIFNQQPTRLALICFGVFAVVLSVFGRRLYKIINIERNISDGISFFVSDMDDIDNIRHWRTQAELTRLPLKIRDLEGYDEFIRTNRGRIRQENPTEVGSSSPVAPRGRK